MRNLVAAGLSVVAIALAGCTADTPVAERVVVAQAMEVVLEKDLPAPVLAAIKSHRRAIFVSGQKITRGGEVEYHLTLKGSRRTAMIVRPDGEVVSFE